MLSKLVTQPLFLLIALLIRMPLASGTDVYHLNPKEIIDEGTLKYFSIVQAPAFTLLALLIVVALAFPLQLIVTISVRIVNQRKQMLLERNIYAPTCLFPLMRLLPGRN